MTQNGSSTTWVGIGYTIATGRLFAPWPEVHRYAEQLLGRAIWTHEFGGEQLWSDLRAALEKEMTHDAT